MISKHLTILPAVAALLLSTACSNDDMDGALADGPVAAQVTADISDGQTATRTSIDSKGTASFTEGDEIHVVASGTTYDYTKQSNGTWAATTPYYFQDSEEVSFQGWYAAPALTLEGNSISINTTSQTTTDGWNQWDILTTPVVTTNVSSPTVNFIGTNAFQHIMSQATITFKAGDGISNLENLTGYTLGTLTTDATFNTLTCALTKGNTTGSITQTVTDASGTEVSSTIILVPQDVTGKLLLEVTYNGQTYTTDLALPDAATALAEGTHYAFNVTIANTGLTVNSAEIRSWSMLTAETSSASLKGYTYNEDTNTYTVYSEAGLLAWSEYTRSGNWSTNCTLANDITLTSNWTAIGDYNNRYTGTFDGNGYTITNLAISASSEYQGLIGFLGSDGSVLNLMLEKVSISSTRNYVGSVVGYNEGTLSYCNITGTVSGYEYCESTGGVVGRNKGAVTACCFEGDVYCSDDEIGGVVGTNYGSVTACCSTGNVSGDNDEIGGVVGRNYGTVTACYSTGNVKGSDNRTGGVVGRNYGSVTACYFAGNVSGRNHVGGVVGRNYDSNGTGTATACYWTNSSEDTGAATYGIGYDFSDEAASNDNATKVDGESVTWATAADTMNGYLTDSGWKYIANDAYTETSSTIAPLLLEAVTE